MSQVEQVEQVNIVSITVGENDTQNFEFSYQEALKHHKIDETNHELCGEVQAQAYSLKG